MTDLTLDERAQEAGCEQPLRLVHVVGLVGVLDAFSARAVEAELADLIAGHRAVTLDLSDIELVTSGGLAMLERCRGVAAETRHELQLRVREGSLVRRVLDVAAPALVDAVERRREPAAVGD